MFPVAEMMADFSAACYGVLARLMFNCNTGKSRLKLCKARGANAKQELARNKHSNWGLSLCPACAFINLHQSMSGAQKKPVPEAKRFWVATEASGSGDLHAFLPADGVPCRNEHKTVVHAFLLQGGV